MSRPIIIGSDFKVDALGQDSIAPSAPVAPDAVNISSSSGKWPGPLPEAPPKNDATIEANRVLFCKYWTKPRY
jgi:hypothetical protein